MKLKLPVPDIYGNYWFGKVVGNPAIMRRRYAGSDHVGEFFVSLGDRFLWNGGDFRYFRTAQMALAALQEEMPQTDKAVL